MSHVRFIGRGTDQRAVTESPLAHHGSCRSATAALPVTTAGEVASWVREELSLPPQASVEVAEQQGTDPRCSDVVTHVGIEAPGEEAYDFHIECPLAEMTRMDLVAAIAFGGAH